MNYKNTLMNEVSSSEMENVEGGCCLCDKIDELIKKLWPSMLNVVSDGGVDSDHVMSRNR